MIASGRIALQHGLGVRTTKASPTTRPSEIPQIAIRTPRAPPCPRGRARGYFFRATAVSSQSWPISASIACLQRAIISAEAWSCFRKF